MNNADSLFMSIAEECREDYVGLWSVLTEVRGTVSDKSLAIEATLHLIKRLLLEADVVAGQFHSGKFKRWEMPVDAIIAKIQRQWAELGRDPGLGDVVWFTAQEEIRGN